MEQQHTLVWYRCLYILKFPATLVFGVFLTVSLLYLMQYLIDSGEKALDETSNFSIVDFVRMKEDLQVKVKQRKPKPPPVPDEPPPEMRQESYVVSVDNSWNAKFEAPLADIDMKRSSIFSSDGDYLPILKVQPMYPRLALRNGWFGWVLLEFTVDDAGKVVNPTVLENCVETYHPGRRTCEDKPGRVFDRSAISAAGKFKYKPRVIDGIPIATVGVIHKITFELNETRDI